MSDISGRQNQCAFSLRRRDRDIDRPKHQEDVPGAAPLSTEALRAPSLQLSLEATDAERAEYRTWIEVAACTPFDACSVDCGM